MADTHFHFSLHIHQAPAVDLSAVVAVITEAKEAIMAQGDELKREVQEQTAQTTAVVGALGTLNTTVNDLKTQLENARNGLTADEAQQLADTLEQGQATVRQALADAGFTPPGEPGPDNPIPGDEPGNPA